MNKIIMLLLVLGGLYFAQQKGLLGDGEPQVEKVAEHNKGFIELNVSAIAGDRKIRMVVVAERDKTLPCEGQNEKILLNMICDIDQACNTIKFECSDQIPYGYEKMFAQQKANAEYFYMKSSKTDLAGAIVFWGLSEREASEICGLFQSRSERRKNEGLSGRCIS